MPKLSEAEFNEFLSEPEHIVRIASVDPDGQPSALAFWFIHRDDRLYVTLRVQSTTTSNVLSNPKIGACIDTFVRQEGTEFFARKIAIQATAEIVYEPGQDREWRQLYYDITRRYFSDTLTEQYLDSTKNIARYLIAIPCKYGTPGVLTSGSGKPGASQIAWPKKYSVPTVATGLES